MTNLRNEIQLMQLYLTGYQFSDCELDFMSNRELRELHADLKQRYNEDINENRMMFFE
jgi:hypothetical protein